MEQPQTKAQAATQTLAEQLRQALLAGEDEALRRLLSVAEPYEIAHTFYHFDAEGQLHLLSQFSALDAAETLLHLDDAAREYLFDEMPAARLATYINLLEPDDGADLIQQVDPEKAQVVMEWVDPTLRREIDSLLAYPEDTAGGIMDPDVVQVRAWHTVERAVQEVREYVARVRLDDFFTLFVVNRTGRLVGSVPAYRMLLADPGQRVEEVMEPHPVAVEAHVDQEEVSRLVRHHGLVTVPVVDANQRLIGRITVDDILDVIHEEHAEDVGRLMGTGTEEVRELSLAQSLKDRAPWLLIALGGQLVSALIMRSREDFLITLPQLAFFIPVVMAMGGNTGIQSSSLVIRGLATGEVDMTHFWRRLGRELLVALGIGCVFAVLLVLSGMAITGGFMLGVTVGLATLATILLASMLGITIPMVLKRFDLDPALATGPFLTTLNDILGIAVYLMVAYVMLF